jgi:hypothetical protein
MDDDGVVVEVEAVGEINMTRLVLVEKEWVTGKRSVGEWGTMILRRGYYESPARRS